jgi:hypothetical protein
LVRGRRVIEWSPLRLAGSVHNLSIVLSDAPPGVDCKPGSPTMGSQLLARIPGTAVTSEDTVCILAFSLPGIIAQDDLWPLLGEGVHPM